MRALHRLTVREAQTVGEGDCSDGGGLLLRIRGASQVRVPGEETPKVGAGPGRSIKWTACR